MLTSVLCGTGAAAGVTSSFPRDDGRRFRRGTRSRVVRCAAAGGAGVGPALRGGGAFSDGAESRQHLATTKMKKSGAELGFSSSAAGGGGGGGSIASSGAPFKAPTGGSISTTATSATTTGTVTSGGYVDVQKKKGLLGGGDATTVQEPPTTSTHTLTDSEIRRLIHAPESVTLVNDVVRLWVTTDGRLHLRRFGTDAAKRRGGSSSSPPTEQLVARSHVQLPREADDAGGGEEGGG